MRGKWACVVFRTCDLQKFTLLVNSRVFVLLFLLFKKKYFLYPVELCLRHLSLGSSGTPHSRPAPAPFFSIDYNITYS